MTNAETFGPNSSHLPGGGWPAAGDARARAARTADAPLVTVVIPTHNRARLVGQAIDSVLAQSHSNCQVVVVDDGSEDDTAAVLMQYGARITYVRQENQGVAAARNAGLRLAAGEFIAFLDSDDAWLPWKLEAQLAVLSARPDVGVVFTDAVEVDARGAPQSPGFLRKYLAAHSKFEPSALFPEAIPLGRFGHACVSPSDAVVRIGDLSSAVLMGNLILTPTAVFRKSLLGRTGAFDVEVGTVGEDYHFFAKLCQVAKVALIDAHAARIRSGGDDHLRARSVDMAHANLRTVERIMRIRGEDIALDRSMVRARLQQSYAWVGIVLFDEGRHAEARAYLRKALRCGPPKARVIAHLAASCLPRSWIARLRTLYSRAKALALRR